MGANWNLPVLSSLYTDVLSMLRDRDSDALTLQVTPVSSPPTGAFRYNRVNNYFEEYDGANYVPKVLSIAGGGTGASTVAGVITSLGLGTMSLQNSDNVTITGGNITGLTNLQATNLSITGSAVFPANSITEGMILDGTILARVAGNETITGSWTTTGNWNITPGTWTVAPNSWTVTAGTWEFKTPGFVRFVDPSNRIWFLSTPKSGPVADTKNWSFEFYLGQFHMLAWNDALNSTQGIFTVDRSAGFNVGPFIFTVPQVRFQNGNFGAPPIIGTTYSDTGIYWDSHVYLGPFLGIAIRGANKSIFHSSGFAIEGAYANLSLVDTGAAPNQGIWQLQTTPSVFMFNSVNDAYNASSYIFWVHRISGTSVDRVSFHTRVHLENTRSVIFGTTAVNSGFQAQDGMGYDITCFITGVTKFIFTSNYVQSAVPFIAKYFHGAAGTAYSIKFDYPAASNDGILHTNGLVLVMGVGFNGTDSGLANTADAGAAIYFTRGYSGDQKGYIQLATSKNGSGSRTIYMGNHENSYAGIHHLAMTDNAFVSGYSGNRWLQVWAVNGTIQTSDIDQKAEIKEIRSGLNFLKALNPIEFTWKEEDLRKSHEEAQIDIDARENNELNRVHFGFAGQELLEKLPFKNGIVYDDGKALNYSNFIAFIVKAIQELSDKVESLETSIAKLPQ